MNLNRLESLIGNKINTIKNLKILIIGLGGVGGYTLESLLRSGVENFTLIDYDIIQSSNINRQIICTSKNIEKYKVDEYYNRALEINPNCKIEIIKEKANLNMLQKEITNYDFIVDACDDVKFKIELIEYCTKNKLPLISCMGTAKKLDATKLEITTIDKTYNDPLAKKIRNELKKRKITSKIKVISSTENVVNKNEVLGSTSYVPAVAGLLITNEIFNNILK